jgi:ABC-type nitrate/sulfonate/bicarbonate transport system substrate-binding protein
VVAEYLLVRFPNNRFPEELAALIHERTEGNPLFMVNAVDYLQSPFAGLGVTDAKMKSNPAQVKRMIRATLKAMEFTRDPANQEKVAGLLMEDFKLDRKTAGLSLRDILKAFTKDGTTSEDAVKIEIKEIREQAKIKAEIPVSQLVDYKLLQEVLAEMRR